MGRSLNLSVWCIKKVIGTVVECVNRTTCHGRKLKGANEMVSWWRYRMLQGIKQTRRARTNNCTPFFFVFFQNANYGYETQETIRLLLRVPRQISVLFCYTARGQQQQKKIWSTYLLMISALRVLSSCNVCFFVQVCLVRDEGWKTLHIELSVEV